MTPSVTNEHAQTEGNGKALAHSQSITSVADFVGDEVQPCKNVAPRGPFADLYTNFCSGAAGSKILFATDDWFATAENLLKDGPPVFIDDLYCEQGKVMDGWETRRRREEGHDWCLIQLSSRAEIYAIEVDTAHFTGNHVPKISIEAADLSNEELSKMVKNLPHAFERMLHGGIQGTGHSPDEVCDALNAAKSAQWKEMLSETPLAPGFEPTRMRYFTLSEPIVGNVVRVNYFPDGGVARLRLWGNPAQQGTPATKPLYMPIQTGEICTVVAHSSTDSPPSQHEYEFKELSSAEHGGMGMACSNKHYGEPWHLIQKSLGKDMGDGWETARHPERPSILHKNPETHLIDSHLLDWAILKLGQIGSNGVARVILDTKHFRGNYPESVMLEGSYDPEEKSDAEWFTLIPRVRMSPDSEHVFERVKDQVHNATRPVSHVRISVFPDGGVSRVRVYG